MDGAHVILKLIWQQSRGEGCQSESKVVIHNCKSDMSLVRLLLRLLFMMKKSYMSIKKSKKSLSVMR